MSVFFLANALRHKDFDSFDSWVEAAASASSFLAAAVDHRPVAEYLAAKELVKVDSGVAISPQLLATSSVADRRTLLAIAGFVLETDPPYWLQSASSGGRLREELIPVDDLASLEWMRPELEQMLLTVSARSETRAGSILGLGLGRAAELVMLASLEHTGASPLHVAELSDRYGYDVETLTGPWSKWEVKGATPSTSSRFHLTRNEFDQALRFPDDWCLVQVEFTPEALRASRITASHLSRCRVLAPRDLQALAPAESLTFRWEGSAMFAPLPELWRDHDLALPGTFELADLRTLGGVARAMRLER